MRAAFSCFTFLQASWVFTELPRLMKGIAARARWLPPAARLENSHGGMKIFGVLVPRTAIILRLAIRIRMHLSGPCGTKRSGEIAGPLLPSLLVATCLA